MKQVTPEGSSQPNRIYKNVGNCKTWTQGHVGTQAVTQAFHRNGEQLLERLGVSVTHCGQAVPQLGDTSGTCGGVRQSQRVTVNTGWAEQVPRRQSSTKVVPGASVLRQAGDPQGIPTPEQGELSLHQGLWRRETQGWCPMGQGRQGMHTFCGGRTGLPIHVWILSGVLSCLMRMLVGWAV